MRRTGTRTVLISGFVVALVLAGVLSFYASGHPDGLEFVADKTGFIDTAEDGATADGPFADYSTKGVGDARIAGGLAGVAGVVVVLLLAGGLAVAVRRRGARATDRREE